MVNHIKFFKPELLLYSFLAFFCSNNLSAQSYSGALIIQDSLSFPYYLKLDQNNVSGYSVSDMQGDTETFSLIDINQSVEEKRFEIEESQVVYTRLNATSYDGFCKIIFKTKLNSKSIDEEFEAMMSNQTPCGNGIVKLESTKSLTAKLNKIKSKIENNKALKTLTSERDRETSIKKIEQLLQLSVFDYSTQIRINPQDFFDFLFFKNSTKITLVFDNVISENFIQVKNLNINQINNTIELIKTSDTTRATLTFTNKDTLAGNSFVVKINDGLSLRFLFPDNFENATFVF
ncbi:hypothetical protein N9X15_04915 [Flavobacteriaceae bacterium]|nr:hypothetical protein [Flavobacteriaceae bacterium]